MIIATRLDFGKHYKIPNDPFDESVLELVKLHEPVKLYKSKIDLKKKLSTGSIMVGNKYQGGKGNLDIQKAVGKTGTGLYFATKKNKNGDVSKIHVPKKKSTAKVFKKHVEIKKHVEFGQMNESHRQHLAKAAEQEEEIQEDINPEINDEVAVKLSSIPSFISRDQAMLMGLRQDLAALNLEYRKMPITAGGRVRVAKREYLEKQLEHVQNSIMKLER